MLTGRTQRTDLAHTGFQAGNLVVQVLFESGAAGCVELLAELQRGLP